MQLYVLRWRGGGLAESVHEPWAPTPAEKNALQQEIAAMPSWLEIPYGVGKYGYPTLKQFMEMAYYYHMLHLFTWGLIHKEAVWATNAALVKWVAVFHTATIAGTVFLFVAAAVLVAGIYWLLNPTTTIDIMRKEHLPRYIFTYGGRLWWADFIGKDSNGRPFYIICAVPQTSCGAVVPGVYVSGERVDRWELGAPYIQWWRKPFNYKEWRWHTFWVDYVGLASQVELGVYRLREPATDHYQAEAPPGYVPPGYLRFKGWFEIP